MRDVPLKKQLITVLLILVMSYSLFTFFPTLFPHPEDFSPYVYAVAFLICIEVWLLIRNGRRRWLLLPVLLVLLLALLDETGYGSEVMDIPPIYSQTLHTEIRDLHNLIGIAVELGSQALKEAHWNGNLFAALLAQDGVLLVAGILFGLLLRFRFPRSEEKVSTRIFRLVAYFWLASGLAATVYLLSLPRDPTNAFFLGYSATRIVSIVITFLISTTPLALLISQRKKPQLKNVTNWLYGRRRAILFVCISLILISFAYQLYAPFVFLPDQQTRLERITPIVLWLLAVAWFALLGAHAWRGGLREPVSKLFGRFADFLRREPAYFYMGSAVFLIVVAQLIDQDIIKLWGLWTEEIFEMNGAFLFIAAAFYFPKRK